MSSVARWIFRLTLAALLAVALGYFPYRAYGPSGIGRVLRLQDDLARTVAENARLVAENRTLLREIQWLRRDRGAMEQVARDELGLVRPHDLVFHFERQHGSHAR